MGSMGVEIRLRDCVSAIRNGGPLNMAIPHRSIGKKESKHNEGRAGLQEINDAEMTAQNNGKDTAKREIRLGLTLGGRTPQGTRSALRIKKIGDLMATKPDLDMALKDWRGASTQKLLNLALRMKKVITDSRKKKYAVDGRDVCNEKLWLRKDWTTAPRELSLNGSNKRALESQGRWGENDGVPGKKKFYQARPGPASLPRPADVGISGQKKL